MGVTKIADFTDEQINISILLKAISHPARMKILQQLIEKKECACGDLVDNLNLAQPTISQHLKELKNANLIQGTVEGTKVCYCINLVTWKELQKQLNNFFDSYKAIDIDQCC